MKCDVRRAAVDVRSIPAFSPVAIQLMNISSQENVGLNQLASLIRADPGMSVEVLRLANSPLFGTRREISGILHALAMLGLSRVRSIVMTVAVRDFLSPARHSRIFAPCWRHSLTCAFVAEWFARELDLDADIAYTAALLHEIGRLGMIAYSPETYETVVRQVHDRQSDLLEAEREWFGADHREIGLRLLSRFQLPDVFRAAVGPRPQNATGLAGLVHGACEMADHLGFRVLEDEPAPANPPSLPGLERIDMEDLMTMVATKINTLECNLVMV